MKRILSLLLSLALMLTLVPSALAATPEALDAANTLYEYGLFKGTGTDQNGRPLFDLDRSLTRSESIAMLVRLLGAEGEAQNGSWAIPFTDVATWAKPYVGYAYARKLTSGTSATTFSGDAPASAAQYITLVLRALGYTSGKDFQWDRAWELSDQIGLTDGRYNASTSTFTRGDAAIISKNALDVYVVGSGKKLGETLGIFAPDSGTNVPITTKSGLDKLIDFVVNNSDIWDDGTSFVYYPIPMKDTEGIETIELSILYDPKSDSDGTFPDGHLFFSGEIYFTNGVKSEVSFIYDIAAKKAFANGITVYFSLSNMDIDVCEATSFSFDIAYYTNTTTLSFDRAYFESNYSSVTYEDYAELFDPCVQMTMVAWKVFLEEAVGITLRDIGFTSY